MHHVMERLSDASDVNVFATCLKTQRAAPAKASRHGPTPNDRPLEPPLSEEDPLNDSVKE